LQLNSGHIFILRGPVNAWTKGLHASDGYKAILAAKCLVPGSAGFECNG
jgi:hypothetical protein